MSMRRMNHRRPMRTLNPLIMFLATTTTVVALGVSTQPAEAVPAPGGVRPAAALQATPPAVRPAATSSACRLVGTIRRAGFTGRDVRIAWAVAMRESNGRANLISYNDYGLFQFNRPSWGRSSWWNTSRLLTADYNARIAKRLVDSRGWRPWGLNRTGTAVYAADYAGIWSQWKIDNWIWKPYRMWYGKFPAC